MAWLLAPACGDGQLVVLGSPRQLPVAPRCVEGEWLAPLAGVLPEFGIRTSYDNNTKSLRVEAPGNRTATLTAGIPELVSGDGVRLSLATAPVVENGVFLVPVSGVARWLGLGIRLDENGDIELDNGVIDIRTRSTADRFVAEIVSSGAVSFAYNTLDDPPRLYVDIPNSRLLAPERVLEIGHPLVQRIRSSQFSEKPNITRVVLDLQGKPKFAVAAGSSPNIIKVVLGEGEKSCTPQRSSPLQSDEGNSATAKTGKGPTAPTTNAETSSPACLRLPTDNARWKDLVIVVDPGHGGQDTGACGSTGILEKDITLDIGQRLAALLRSTGATVLMTRDDDSYPTLRQRVALAEENRAHIFISIHVNAAPTRNQLRGTETYYYTAQSLRLAKWVHQSMVECLRRKDNGVRQRKFYVIHHTSMPSVLTEAAYINCDEEEQLLGTPEFRQKAAEAIFNGVRNFVQLTLKRKPDSAASTVVGARSLRSARVRKTS